MSKFLKRFSLNFIIVLIDVLTVYVIAINRWIDLMPTIIDDAKKSLINPKWVTMYLGNDLIVLLISFLTTITYLLIDKYIVKTKKSVIHYILFFMYMVIINMIVYSMSIGRAY